MGLDGVELVMSFEEAFGIQITDEEATNCRTPRMVIDVIFAKLKTADEQVCRSQRAFYIIRKVLISMFGLERKSITPDTRFQDWIPKSQEKQMWEQVKAAISPRSWPGLVRPLWMSRSLTAIGLIIFATTAFGAAYLERGTGPGIKDWVKVAFVSAYGGMIVAGLFGVVAGLLTRPYRIYIPRHVTSIRDLIPHAITSDRMTGWTREEVAAVVKRITMEQLGLDESEYTEDSRFVEDFRLDS